MKAWILYCTMLMLCIQSEAQSLDSLVHKGNSAYEAGNYEEAIVYYEQADSIIVSAELELNLGNAYYKNSDLAHAILHYERASKLNPSDMDISHNLTLARSMTLDELDGGEGNAFASWWNALLLRAGMDRLAWFGIIAGLFSALAWLLFRLSKGRGRRQMFFSLGTVTLLISLAALLMSFSAKAALEDRTEGIIMSNRVNVMSAPDELATELFILHEGTKVKIELERGSWNSIVIPNGNKGWIKSYQVEGI